MKVVVSVLFIGLFFGELANAQSSEVGLEKYVAAEKPCLRGLKSKLRVDVPTKDDLGAPAVVFLFFRYDSMAQMASVFSQVNFAAGPSQHFVTFSDSLAFEAVGKVSFSNSCRVRDKAVMVLPVLVKHPADFWKGYGTAMQRLPSARDFYAFLDLDTSVTLLPYVYLDDPKGRINDAEWEEWGGW